MEGHIISLLFACLRLIAVNSVEYDLEIEELTTGSAILPERGSTQIICSVENATDYSISWYRETPTGDRTAIYRDGMLINNNLGREAEAYSLHSVFDVTITQVRGKDLGRLLNGNNYTCEVTENSTGEVVLVSSGFILTAYYLPSSMYPICESCDFSCDLIGSSITISCYSEPGNPSGHLQWSRNGEEIKNLQTITTPSLNYLNYTFILEADDLESSFSCTNGQQICNLTTNQACAGGKNLPSDSGTQPALLTVIGASIGAVLFLALCILFGVLLYRRRDSKEKVSTAFQEQSTKKESAGISNNQERTSRNEFIIDNVSNHEYVEVTKLKTGDKNLRESLHNESGIVDNIIYVGYDSDNIEIAKP